MRGRDIKRYQYVFADLYIIATFPSKTYDIEMYPAVKQHLLSFDYHRLKQTGEPGARKKTNNKWFESQDSINYWEDFSMQKIVWIELIDSPNFCLDNEGFYTNNTVFFLSGSRLPYILSFLNSKLCEWHFTKIAATSGVGTRRWIKVYIQQICVPQLLPNTTEELLGKLAIEIQETKKKGGNSNALENQIDTEIFKLFNLTNEEVEYIRNDLIAL